MLAGLAIATAAFAQDTRALGRVSLEVIGSDRSPQQVTLYESSHALIVGASRYKNGWPSLPGVRADIIEVRAALESHGFTISQVDDPTGDELRYAIQLFINEHGARSDARLLFYFAGHGHTRTAETGREMGYIVPIDAPLPNSDIAGFRRTALSMQNFDTWAKEMEARHVLFLFDSCFSGSIFSLSRSVPASISIQSTQPIRQFISSGAANQEVPDESDFRREFIRALDGAADLDRDGFVTGSELGMFLFNQVTNYSNGAQTPQYGKIRDPFLDRGDFVFQVGHAAPRPTPFAVPPPRASLVPSSTPSPVPSSVSRTNPEADRLLRETELAIEELEAGIGGSP